MAQIMRIPSNELYTRVQSNTSLTKQFKKDILNLYKRHPSVALMALNIIDEINAKNLVPHSAVLVDAMSYYWDDKDAFMSAPELEDIRTTYANYMDITNNVLMFHFSYTWKKLPCNVTYFVLELENGEFKTIVNSDNRGGHY